MTRHPNLKGRYDGKVLSPLQRGLLYAIGFILVMAFQIDQLLTASFTIELFDHEIARVEHADRQAHARHDHVRAPRPIRIPSVSPEDWPAPPVPTDWSPQAQALQPVFIVAERPDGDRLRQ